MVAGLDLVYLFLQKRGGVANGKRTDLRQLTSLMRRACYDTVIT